MFRPFLRPRYSRIGKDSFLPACSTPPSIDVGFVGAVPTTVCTTPRRHHPNALHPKCHWLPFLVWCISGSRASPLSWSRRRGDDGGVDNRNPAASAGRALPAPSNLLEQHPRQLVTLKPVPELQQLVASGTGSGSGQYPQAAQAWLSYTASSNASSASPYHCCMKVDPQIRSTRSEGDLAHRWDRGSQALHQPRPRHHLPSISAKNLSRRVCFFCRRIPPAKRLPCRCIVPSHQSGRFYPRRHHNRAFFSFSLGKRSDRRKHIFYHLNLRLGIISLFPSLPC